MNIRRMTGPTVNCGYHDKEVVRHLEHIAKELAAEIARIVTLHTVALEQQCPEKD